MTTEEWQALQDELYDRFCRKELDPGEYCEASLGLGPAAVAINEERRRIVEAGGRIGVARVPHADSTRVGHYGVYGLPDDGHVVIEYEGYEQDGVQHGIGGRRRPVRYKALRDGLDITIFGEGQ
jgi:hypothetical protein